MAIFQVTVQTTTSQPIPGAALRLFGPSGTDITATRFGASPVQTDAAGMFTRFFAALGPDRLPSGIYTITASAAGYTSQSVTTTLLFTGTGSFVIELAPIAGDPEDSNGGAILSGPAAFVSPMAPVEAVITGSDGVTGWEYIEATITDGQGESSIMEVPVVNGFARINLQARLELEPVLRLIPDAVPAVIDNDFSKQATVTLASLTAGGSRQLTGEFSVSVGNAFPIADQNDLTNFTNTAGLADWLTPWEEMPVFRGHPADAAIWLLPGSYGLRTAFFDINRAALSQTDTALPAELFAAGSVVKIRIPEPIAGSHYASLIITLGGVAQTKPLTVQYKNG